MQIKTSYFVRLGNGTNAWLAVGKEIPDGATIVEERPMLLPDDGMVLRNKSTGEISYGHWQKDGNADDWEEIPVSEIETPEGE